MVKYTVIEKSIREPPVNIILYLNVIDHAIAEVSTSFAALRESVDMFTGGFVPKRRRLSSKTGVKKNADRTGRGRVG